MTTGSMEQPRAGMGTWPVAQDRRLTAIRCLILIAIVLVGAVLRTWRLDQIVLRQDEGFSLLYARQPWVDVLGMHGAYDFHPPGFFALAKVSSLVVDELIAGRVVSVGAAVLTLPVFWMLATHLLDATSGLVATALLAVAPLFVMYSRVARGYALVMLLVLVTWLALVRYRQTGDDRWAALYGIAVCLAMYADYAAIYALIPQAVVLAVVIRERRRQSLALVIAITVAVIAYAPWLILEFPETVRSSTDYTRRLTYLAANWDRFWDGLRGLVLGADVRDLDTRLQMPWTRNGGVRAAVAGLIGVLCLPGLIALRCRPFALAVVMAMTVGTVMTVLALSLISPGWDARTVLPAVPGICLVLAAPCSGLTGSRRFVLAGRIAAGLVGVIWLLSLTSNYSNANRQYRFDLMVKDLAAANGSGFPVLTYSTGGMDTDLLQVYGGEALAGVPILTFVDGPLEQQSLMSRWLTRGPTRLDVRANGIAPYLPDGETEAFWFVTHRNRRDFEAAFKAAGFVRVLSNDYVSQVLELWTQPDADLGEGIVLADGQWVATDPDMWVVSVPGGEGVILVAVPAEGVAAGAIGCRDRTGAEVREEQLETLQPDYAGGETRFGVQCPTGTTTVSVAVTSAHAGMQPVVELRTLSGSE